MLIRVIKQGIRIGAGCLAGMGDSDGAYNILVGRPEGKRPLRIKWDDIIKMDLQEGMD